MRYLAPLAFALLTGCAGMYVSQLDDAQKRYGSLSSVPPSDSAMVADETVRIGMDRAAVEAAFGPPSGQNVTMTADTRRVQLVYESLVSSAKRAYVYLENGRVVSAQNTGQVSYVNVVR